MQTNGSIACIAFCILGQNYSQACEEVRGRFLLSHDGVEVSDGSKTKLGFFGLGSLV